MALEKLEALETRVRSLVQLTQELKREKTALEAELRKARERLIKQEEEHRRWETERTDIRSRIEKVLNELDVLGYMADPKEVGLEQDRAG
jgi:chromosome segregation ATPase